MTIEEWKTAEADVLCSLLTDCGESDPLLKKLAVNASRSVRRGGADGPDVQKNIMADGLLSGGWGASR
ncbi:hypothetical protein KTAU_40490 [Thermogemmatispora aurantia]|uniref:Uncharacterized protein n=1 Tax=Thermogemmatispora aurantia TaxID=2045279 RepID=A0A5J4KA28_9CHLR|nr:hypothetical protein KTAU_40490 [Thermogemmatispora aurantia]